MSKKEVTILSWHSTKSTVQYAGGFRRLYEILQRAPANINVTCIDTKPSFLRTINKENIKLVEYKIPDLIEQITKLNFLVGKFFERAYVVMFFTQYLLTHKKTTVYVPFSELPQLTIPAIVSKLFVRNKVIFCNLNPNTFFVDKVINKITHKLSDLNITISNQLKLQLLRTGINCSYVNPVGINFKQYFLNIPKYKNITGIFIGRHVKEKGIYTALEVCALLNKKMNFSLICIGDIPLNEKDKIESELTKLNIKSKVRLLGITSEEEKINYLSSSHVCIFPSTQEGWGIVPQESIMCHTPVVAFNLPVYKENIAKCLAVTLVPESDIDEFLKSISDWLTMDKDQISKKLSQSIKIIKKFDWSIIAKKEWELICQL
ncbi:MAG: Glycosyl transferase, group 1 [Candidatus Woesebacteria bacterium GW2011_GWB1_39_10]|uniref:Glycosyl transferase, group 1 n=1 Tax=Candidatus Woesebacteria bacterium GW2011_GWB1_39_10 TaxID=1618572 RepID=A0A0G0LHX1_9BACT|nr:MAG: Glycosyl transferase, group 1 [Candidatus Woesebacteria bacterium GW2011_GWB1_39_10]